MTTQEVPYYIVDAFSSGPFTGNPAGVCPLDRWLPDTVLQSVAAQNNLAETAFFIQDGDSFQLRWFAPSAEVDLCGHATIATAHVIYEELGSKTPVLRFNTRSGLVSVARRDGQLKMDLPRLPLQEHDAPVDLIEGLGVRPTAVYKSMDWVCVFDDKTAVEKISPDLERLKRLDLRGVIATAPAVNVDYVLRCFGPKVGIPEDPVTGSAQSMLAPYWAGRLGKQTLSVQQLSTRGGTLFCSVVESAIEVSGQARTYMRGRIYL